MDSLDDRIARLLRLKRYEQPPPGYYENFLDEFRRRRRRDELFREPFWSICVERLRDFMFRHKVRALAGYSAGVATAAACIALIAITVFQQPVSTPLAVQTSPVPTAPPMMDRQLDVEDTPLDMQATLRPGSTDLLLMPASDERVPLNLEGELLDDQSMLAIN